MITNLVLHVFITSTEIKHANNVGGNNIAVVQQRIFSTSKISNPAVSTINTKKIALYYLLVILIFLNLILMLIQCAKNSTICLLINSSYTQNTMLHTKNSYLLLSFDETYGPEPCHVAERLGHCL